MRRDGTIIPSDLKDDGLAVRRAACGRSRRYSVKRLEAWQGALVVLCIYGVATTPFSIRTTFACDL
jgi:hypothetical protein